MKPNALRSYALTAAALVLGATAVVGQINGTLSGPIIGYFFSVADRTFRPLQGLPGSAMVGSAISVDFQIGQVLALDGKHMVVSSSSNANLLNVSLEAIPVTSSPISVPASPSVSAASPRGNTAAFYYPGKGAYIVTGLPKAPSVRTLNLGRNDQAVTKMAVSFDGALLVYAVKDENGESLYSWSNAGATRLVGQAKSVGGMVITSNGGVIVADRGASEVFAVWDLRGNATRQFLADARDGVSSPVAVTTSPRNDIYVANAASVTVLDSTGHVKYSRACGCAPSGIYWMKDSLFRLTDRGDQTVYMLDGADDRIFFVPPPLVTP